MVVMSRSKGQSVMIGDQIIGDNIVVTIVEIVGDRVRFGVNAPPDNHRCVVVRQSRLVLSEPISPSYNLEQAFIGLSLDDP